MRRFVALIRRGVGFLAPRLIQGWRTTSMWGRRFLAIRWRSLTRDLLTLRFFVRALGRSRNFEDLTALRMAVFFSIGGFLFDSIKAVLSPDWRPFREHGQFLFLFYLGCNLLPIALVAKFRRMRLPASWGRLLLGVSLLLSGVLNWLGLFVSIQERAFIPLVWHATFGFMAGLLLAFATTAHHIRRTWTAVARQRAASALDIRKELSREFQWSITSAVVQSITAFVAAVGVNMSILWANSTKGQWIPTDSDLNGTSIQIATGLGVCLMAMYWWGISRGVDGLAWVRKRWLYGL